MDFHESDEQIMLRQSAAGIASRFGHDWFVRKARANERSDELWQALAQQGFIGVNTPEAYGGGGMGIGELSIVCEEMAAAGCPLLLMLVSPAICASIIAKHGSDEQRERWLPQMASGAIKMAFAITEPDAGTNSHRISTTATRDGDGWVLRGTKYYISGVDESAAVLVVARTGGDPASGKGELSLFIVDVDSPGLESSLIPVEIVAPEKQFTLFFDGVRVGADRLIGTEGNGLRQVFVGLNPERIMTAAISNGLGRYALAKGAAYANERNVWGVPVGTYQGLAHPLAKAKVEVELARLMTQKAAWLYDRGLEAGEAANIAKYAAGEAAIAALDQAIQIHGGNGMASEFGLADMWGLARLLRIAPVSREMVLNYVSQHSLGLPKSY
ncbi:MAG TPA: acyl-CoA dehydrogenase family protein [Candidatus Dormibacteraeota bacterium]|nr:acyl-CoA dehydrogenase family protein [Candidatus Dormibacteraeota bacterium]